MDLILLSLLSRVLRFATTIKRLLLSTTLGAVWSVIVLVIPTAFKLFVNLCTYTVICFVMVYICSGIKIKNKSNIRYLLKGVIMMYAIAMLMGGGIHILYYYTYAGYIIQRVVINDKNMFVFIIISLILVCIILNIMSIQKRYGSVKRHLIISVNGKIKELDAIIDTGNILADPFSGKPVTVVERDIFNDILNEINDYEKIKYHLIPFRTVGTGEKMMEVITTDYIYIIDGEKTKVFEKALIGMSDVKLSCEGEYQALINGNMI